MLAGIAGESSRCSIGPLGLARGLAVGLSCILGIVEYEPVRPGCELGVALLTSGFSGHSSGFSTSLVVAFSFDSGGGR